MKKSFVRISLYMFVGLSLSVMWVVVALLSGPPIVTGIGNDQIVELHLGKSSVKIVSCSPSLAVSVTEQIHIVDPAVKWDDTRCAFVSDKHILDYLPVLGLTSAQRSILKSNKKDTFDIEVQSDSASLCARYGLPFRFLSVESQTTLAKRLRDNVDTYNAPAKYVRFCPPRYREKNSAAGYTWWRGTCLDGLLPSDIDVVGALGNMACWGFACWFAVMGFVRLRQWSRRRRHCCSECGYSIVGLQTAVCPECGAIRSSDLTSKS